MANDIEWMNAVRAAAKGLREGNGALGHGLAHRLCFGEPLSTQERVDLARLVTDRLLPEPDGRPVGETQLGTIQIAAAIEYYRRLGDPNRTQKSDEIKADIGSPLKVGSKTVGRWVTEYRKNVQKIDEYLAYRLQQTLDRLAGDLQAERISSDEYEALVAEANAAPDGHDVMRRHVELNSK